MIAPRDRLVGTIVRWSGIYYATSGTSIVCQVQTYQLCSSGGACTSCPGDPQTCRMAQSNGMEPGVQHQSSVQLQGTNQFVGQDRATWFRVR